MQVSDVPTFTKQQQKHNNLQQQKFIKWLPGVPRQLPPRRPACALPGVSRNHRETTGTPLPVGKRLVLSTEASRLDAPTTTTPIRRRALGASLSAESCCGVSPVEVGVGQDNAKQPLTHIHRSPNLDTSSTSQLNSAALSSTSRLKH